MAASHNMPLVLFETPEAVLNDLDPDFDLAGTINQREPRYNLAPAMRAAVMICNADQRLEVKGLRWGLIPHSKTAAREGSR